MKIQGSFSVSPAPAGMIPIDNMIGETIVGEPRTRGDDPVP